MSAESLRSASREVYGKFTENEQGASSDGSPQADHLVVLIHGLWGNPKHLSYLASALREKYAEDQTHLLVAKTNKDTFTYDGIDLGAERVTQEIEEFIKHLKQAGKPIAKLSIVGYSLGGLVARYAIGLLYSKGYFESIEPVNFTTFATPHLGVRTPVLGIHSQVWNLLGSSTLSASGRQLFTIDTFQETGQSLISFLADPNTIFIRALRMFRKRVLYANCVNDRSAPYYTTSISSIDPFKNLDSITLNYLPAYEPNILDPANPFTVLPRKDQPPLVSRVLSSTQTLIPQIPLLALLTVLVPIGSIVFLVNSGIQSFRSQKRIRLHEEGKTGLGFGSYRIPFVIENARNAVEDALERVNSRQEPLRRRTSAVTGEDTVGRPAKDRPNLNRENTSHSQESDRLEFLPDLALSTEQFRMIKNLDEVGFKKIRVFIHKVRHSHASIVRRTMRKNYDEGEVVIRHWLNEEFEL